MKFRLSITAAIVMFGFVTAAGFAAMVATSSYSLNELKVGGPLYVRIPTKPAMHSNSKPAGYSDLKPATRGVVCMSQIHDVVEGWEGQETGWF